MHNEECAVGAFPCETIHNRHKAELIRMRQAERDEESRSSGELVLLPSQALLCYSRWVVSKHQPQLSFLLLLLSKKPRRGEVVRVTVWQAVS